jgi:hypothetical protein
MRSKQFKKKKLVKEKLDMTLEIAQIQKLAASAAKDRQIVKDRMDASLNPIKQI